MIFENILMSNNFYYFHYFHFFFFFLYINTTIHCATYEITFKNCILFVPVIIIYVNIRNFTNLKMTWKIKRVKIYQNNKHRQFSKNPVYKMVMV